jgi:GNAT superfamily N-acetyltransferase
MIHNRVINETRNGYLISDDREQLQVNTIHQFLCNDAYWSPGIPLATVEKGIAHSFCVGVYLEEQQVAFARVVTDYTSFAWLCDVFVLEAHRKKGISKWMMQFIMNHPNLQGFRSWFLGTKDAHQLYAQFGFKPLEDPTRFMAIRKPGIYLENNAGSV